MLILPVASQNPNMWTKFFNYFEQIRLIYICKYFINIFNPFKDDFALIET